MLRVKPGDEVVVFDGAGRQADAVVQHADRNRLDVTVTRVTEHPFELAYKLTLAVAMPKAHRRGYLIEKCTELGVAAIQPIITERSVAGSKPGAVEKWSRRAIEAAKQSKRTWVPRIETPTLLAKSIECLGEFDAAALADASPHAVSFSDFLETLPQGGSIMLWIGPEGGWSDAERGLAAEAGLTTVRLSPTVLRTETAAAVACAAVAMSS